MSKTVIGIDPGKNGGIAICDGKECRCVKMPSTPSDLLCFLQEAGSAGNCVAYLEKVGGMPGQGASASFVFGENYGHITLALLASKIPTEVVSPQRWQNFLNLRGKKGESKTDHKNRMKARAQQLFPSEKVTLWSADALLIAHYGIKQELGADTHLNGYSPE